MKFAKAFARWIATLFRKPVEIDCCGDGASRTGLENKQK